MSAKKKPAKRKTYEELSMKQQRFVDYYDGNATQAAEKAGYKNAKQVGSLNMTKVDIADAIRTREDRRRKGDIMDREDRQRFWTECVRFDIAKLYDKEGNLKSVHELDGASARFVQGVKVTTGKEGTIEYKIPDRLKASEHLGRSEADFTDNHNLGGELVVSRIKKRFDGS